MHRVHRTLLATALLLVAATTPAAQLAGIDSEADRLVRVDASRGTATKGPSTAGQGLDIPAGLTWVADTNELWTVDLNGGELGVVDAGTGRFQQRFATGLSGWQALTWLPATRVFVLANQDGKLYRFDPQAKALTAIGKPNVGLITALATDPQGRLWSLSIIGGELARLDATTAAATVVGRVGAGFQGLAIDGFGRFWAANTGDDSLYSIDPSTPAATRIGPFGADAPFVKGLASTSMCGLQTVGVGCLDSGGTRLAMTTQGAPCRTNTLTVDVRRSAGGTTPLLAVGLSDTNWSGLRLPYSLFFFGAPGCSILASQEILLTAPTRLTVRDDPTLDGLRLHVQAWRLDARANALGIVSSNLLQVTIGG